MIGSPSPIGELLHIDDTDHQIKKDFCLEMMSKSELGKKEKKNLPLQSIDGEEAHFQFLLYRLRQNNLK